MKMPSAHALELYFLEQEDGQVRFGDQPALLSLLEMSICLQAGIHGPAQSLPGAERVEHIRQRMKGVFDPRQYLNRCLKERRRPKPRSKFEKRYFRLRKRRYWQGGGIADCTRLAAQFKNAEAEIRCALHQVFSVLSPVPDAPESNLHWAGSAGISGQGSYSILGRSMMSKGYYLPRFSVMRAHGAAASNPDRAWTPAILEDDEALRTADFKGSRLLNEMDFTSPLGLLVGLNGLSFELQTELASTLSMTNVGQWSRRVEQGQWDGLDAGDLYVCLSLVSCRHHAECAMTSLRAYLRRLTDLAALIHSAASKKWVAGKVLEAESQLRTLERRLPPILKEVEDVLASVNYRNAPIGARWGVIVAQINRYGEGLQTDVVNALGRLYERTDGRLEWRNPQLSCEVKLMLPAPYWEDTAVPFKLGAVIDWSSIAASLSMGGQFDCTERMGWLAKVISDQGLPLWAWPCISEIRVEIRMSAAITAAKITDQPRLAAQSC